MEINQLVNFKIEKVHSNKKDKDYWAIVIDLNGIKKVVAFLTETEYQLLTSSLK